MRKNKFKPVKYRKLHQHKISCNWDLWVMDNVELSPVDRVYVGMKKRYAKKLVKSGKMWGKIQQAFASIQVGSIIHTCRGYNEKVVSISAKLIVRNNRRGYVIYDLDLEFPTGSCSLQHCITMPAFTKEEVMQYWQAVAANKSNWDFGKQHNTIKQAIIDGICPFDDDGCLLPDYVVSSNNGMPHIAVTEAT